MTNEHKPLTDELLRVIERDARSAVEQRRGYMDPSEIVLLCDEIRKLREANGNLSDCCVCGDICKGVYVKGLEEEQADNAALCAFAQHHTSCDRVGADDRLLDRPCTCGLDELLKEAKP